MSSGHPWAPHRSKGQYREEEIKGEKIIKGSKGMGGQEKNREEGREAQIGKLQNHSQFEGVTIPRVLHILLSHDKPYIILYSF